VRAVLILQQTSADRLGKPLTLNQMWRDLAKGILPRHRLPEPWCHLTTASALKNEWNRLPDQVRSTPGNFMYSTGKPTRPGPARSRKKI
jgi:hypothetical protein